MHIKIILGITGSIAAFKSIELVRLCQAAGAEVRVILSESAAHFVTPLTLSTISGHPCGLHTSDWSLDGMAHIEWARWADLILIAPASAHCIAKLTQGFADDLLSAVCLASAAPLWMAPAMNQAMWSHAATQENVERLVNRNIRFLGPETGLQACGECGSGRMREPQELFNDVRHFFFNQQSLSGKRFLITAGPTHEAIDPIRYLGNRSSGKMGYALATCAAQQGAEVTLISGPVHLKAAPQIKTISVVSAEQMAEEVMRHTQGQDVFISAAAVSDYRMTQASEQKIKKTQDKMTLCFERTPDIVSMVAGLAQGPIVVGFAAETEHVIAHAQQKLKHKKLDMIIANYVDATQGMESDDNELFLITPAPSAVYPLEKQTTNMSACTVVTKAHEYIEDRNDGYAVHVLNRAHKTVLARQVIEFIKINFFQKRGKNSDAI